MPCGGRALPGAHLGIKALLGKDPRAPSQKIPQECGLHPPARRLIPKGTHVRSESEQQLRKLFFFKS